MDLKVGARVIFKLSIHGTPYVEGKPYGADSGEMGEGEIIRIDGSVVWTTIPSHNSTTYRKDMWSWNIDRFGHSIWLVTESDNNNSISNNDGRDTCYKCHEPTKTIGGFNSSVYNCCDNSVCEWFQN